MRKGYLGLKKKRLVGRNKRARVLCFVFEQGSKELSMGMVVMSVRGGTDCKNGV